jgi:hypothetical protein
MNSHETRLRIFHAIDVHGNIRRNRSGTSIPIDEWKCYENHPHESPIGSDHQFAPLPASWAPLVDTLFWHRTIDHSSRVGTDSGRNTECPRPDRTIWWNAALTARLYAQPSADVEKRKTGRKRRFHTINLVVGAIILLLITVT